MIRRILIDPSRASDLMIFRISKKADGFPSKNFVQEKDGILLLLQV